MMYIQRAYVLLICLMVTIPVAHAIDVNEIRKEYENWKDIELSINRLEGVARRDALIVNRKILRKAESKFRTHIAHAYQTPYYRNLTQQINGLSEDEYREYITILKDYQACIDRINAGPSARSELLGLMAFMAKDIRGDTNLFEKIWWMSPAAKTCSAIAIAALGLLGYAIYQELHAKKQKHAIPEGPFADE